MASCLTFHPQDLVSSSPYFLSYNYYDVRWKNLITNQQVTPSLIFFFILFICLLDIVLIL